MFCYVVAAVLCLAEGIRNVPTAVNFERTCIIIMTVITRANICMKSFAAWKMSVLAISIVLE